MASLRHAVFEQHGPNLPPDLKVDSRLDVFKLFWSDYLEEEQLERTRQREEPNGTRIPNKEDLHRFLIAGLLMCITTRPDYRKHWSKDDMYSNNLLPKIISRDKFDWILSSLHPDPHTMQTALDSHFRRYWIPEQHVVVDEGLVCFKGRYRHRVHIRGKPDATGLKMYSLADGLGYLWSFWQYDGETSTVPEIVEGFLDKLPSNHYKVYVDSWYGSEQLALNLHQQGFLFTMGCGKNKSAELFDKFLDVQLAAHQARYV